MDLQRLKNPGTRVILMLLDTYEGRDGLRKVQKALNRMGFSLEEDGIIGPITIDAIKRVDNRELHAELEKIMLGVDDSEIQDGNVQEPFWLEYAYDELGTKEIPGRGSNKRVEQYHSAAGGAGWTDDVPWCASFVTFVMKKAGYSAPKYPARAKSWLNFGKTSTRPVLGAIAVKSRKGGGHVCFVVGRDKSGKYLYCLGGNQSDAVNIKKYPASVFLDFRVPVDYDLSQADLPVYNGKASWGGKES